MEQKEEECDVGRTRLKWQRKRIGACQSYQKRRKQSGRQETKLKGRKEDDAGVFDGGFC